MQSIATQIHTNVRHVHEPAAVLIFPILLNGFIWVRHPQRGWEVPGGKIEHGECAIEAVRREGFEEAGIQSGNIHWIGEYCVLQTGAKASYKWVYVVEVKDVMNRPSNSEIVDVQWMKNGISPAIAQRRNDVSFIMKDEMYEVMWDVLFAEPIVKKERSRCNP